MSRSPASYSGLLIGAVGKTHLDIQDLAIMRAMPDITVLAPADATELVAMMDWADATDGAVYLRLARDAVPDLFGATTCSGRALFTRCATAPTSLWSPPGRRPGRVLAAADRWGKGRTATVVHIPCLKPLDDAACEPPSPTTH